jgi:DNA repair protein RadC
VNHIANPRNPMNKPDLNTHVDSAYGEHAETVARYRLNLVREAIEPYDEPILCNEPDSAARFIHHILDGYDREVVGALFLNTTHRTIGHTLAYVGTLTAAPVEPRGLFVPALLANSASIILFHCHPCGDPAPSDDDFRLTARLVAAGSILGVKVLDHIIIGEPPRYESLYRLRPWPANASPYLIE